MEGRRNMHSDSMDITQGWIVCKIAIELTISTYQGKGPKGMNKVMLVPPPEAAPPTVCGMYIPPPYVKDAL